MTQISTVMQYKSSLSIQKETLLHIILWLVVAYFSLVSPGKGILLSMFQLTWIIVLVATFYFNYLVVLPRVFNKINILKVIAGLLTTYLFFIFFRYLVEEIIMSWLFNSSNYPVDVSPIHYAYDNLYFGSQPVVLSTFFWLIIRNIRLADYNRFIAEEQKVTEIKFLKAQINPHFIFNTLNNIYSMVYFKSEGALPAVAQLSNIMRFTTYQSQKDRIPLSDEISYIESLIELESLRHEVTDFVQWELQTEDPTLSIPPYILSPFVENALKHGQISPETPITIHLKTEQGSLSFSIINTINHAQKDSTSGIGIDNVKKRLEIYYPNQHQLNIQQQGQQFIVRLQIKLL
ncbi:sensor histidine kinase [Niabella hibiscisoli]|uniref:sensor histidine kinase n=1 Tax=Niabella hibiscisoli TaxID=1825928 RepID=UPI001F0D625C|nr:histidine kinase [Niabella hibiscisoli]MCH5718861.1 histidine kinase [Niabella hibiscisoli]